MLLLREINKRFEGERTNRPLKLALLSEFKNCFWCGEKVFDYIHTAGETTPPNAATVDHLKSRFFRNKGEVVTKVLACEKCNQRRSHEENKKYTKIHQEKKKNAG